MKKLVGNQKGFSLVELVIVIAIMAVLIGLLAPQFIKHVERSRESKDLQNIENVKSAIEAYVADNKMEAGDEITITVSGTSATVGGAAYKANSLSEYGVSDSITLSSSKWDANVLRYNMAAATYYWTADSDLATTGATYFYYDGTSRS